MSEATVNAGDIARLVDVGRAAVSNWRRRHEDFPQPVGGTATSPLFSLREVEDWLRRNGKSYELSAADRAWQRLRAEGDDLRLGELVASAAVLLLRESGFFTAGAMPRDTEAILDLARENGPATALDLLCERYVEAHSRRLTVTSPEVAELMIRLAGADTGTVLDPACGLGTLLLGTPLLGGSTDRVLGQDIDPVQATIAEARLVLHGLTSAVVCADSLRQNGFPGLEADTVVCEPPFGDTKWGYAELTADPRWVYGLPPRGEPELAWVQHCLALVRPGGRVAILLPSAAASRRPGRRIRGNLLRAGALRAVVTLPATGSDLWLLRRPEPQERPPSQLILMEAGTDLSTVDLEAGEKVRIIDLLDDDVDLSPARRRGGNRDLGSEFSSALRRFHDLAPAAAPELEVLARRRSLPTTTLGELIKAGLVSVRHSPARMGEGDQLVLTFDDLADGLAPTGRAGGFDLVTAEPGDVIASPLGIARVATAPVTLGAHLAAYRVDPERMDAEFLAGALRAGDHRAHLGSSRVDARRTQLPRLSLAEQRTYGAAFRRLAELADALRETAAAGQALVRLGFDGLVDGSLGPRS
ncbi:N-6 DNA methylase [Allokutzneria multivorans]|uniref:N-6 DNA methylase n=1 Tax=Allokutzneria multivorans TaxID=1142134 RepID=A0ABP7SQJ5_9PSEU